MRVVLVVIVLLGVAGVASAQTSTPTPTDTATPTATPSPVFTATATPELSVMWTLAAPEETVGRDVVMTYTINLDQVVTAVLLVALLILAWLGILVAFLRGWI